MNWAQWASDRSIGFFEAIRSRRALDVATDPRRSTLRTLAGHRYALVTTFRRSGAPVPTPVWFGLEGEVLYFRSTAAGAKVARLTADPRVLVAACSANGRPTGPPVEGVANVVDDQQEAAHAEEVIRANYRLARRIYVALIGSRVPGVYVRVRQADS